MNSDFQLGAWRVQPQLNQLGCDERTIRLEPKMMQVLVCLAQRPGEVVSKEQLVQEVWRGTFVTDDVLIRCVSQLRKVFGDSAAKPAFIETIPKSGYRLLVPVTSVSCPDEPRDCSEHKLADSIAILPFENTGDYPDMEYLSDGIAETIINNLSQLGGLRVVPRSLAFQYKGKTVDPAIVGRELRVKVVLTGHVVQRGDRLVIGAELIDTTHESQIWGATYDRTPDDIFSIQDEIASEISNSLQLQMTDAERLLLTKHPTQSREAYHLHLKAMYFVNKWTPEGFRKGLDYLRQAIEADPAYSEAYAGLANLYTAIGFFGGFPPIEAFPRAKAAAIKALEIDDRIANAHAALAFVRLVFDRDLQSAEAECRRAIQLGPQLRDGHYAYSCWCLTMGRYEAAEAEAKRALDLDPLSATTNFHLAAIQYFCRRYDDAIAQLERTIELDPHFAPAQGLILLTYALKGKHQEAMVLAERGVALAGGDLQTQALWGTLCALTGKQDTARGVLDKLKEGSKPPYFSFAYACAGIHALLGEHDQAFEWLDKACLAHDGMLIYLGAAPEFDGLRDDPRFCAILRRIGISSSSRRTLTQRSHHGDVLRPQSN
jgi:TolB-like protein/Tfp pilus assembly protein PilF